MLCMLAAVGVLHIAVLTATGLPALAFCAPQVTRGLFGNTKGSFTSFFTRTGYGGGSPGQGMEAFIHGGAMGGFRQVRCLCCWRDKGLHRCSVRGFHSSASGVC